MNVLAKLLCKDILIQPVNSFTLRLSTHQLCCEKVNEFMLTIIHIHIDLEITYETYYLLIPL